MSQERKDWKTPMEPSQLEVWLARRKKCAPMKSKKDYTRKKKHKRKFENSEDFWYNFLVKFERKNYYGKRLRSKKDWK